MLTGQQRIRINSTNVREKHVELIVFLPAECTGPQMFYFRRSDAGDLVPVTDALEFVSTKSFVVSPIHYSSTYIILTNLICSLINKMIPTTFVSPLGRKYLRINE